MDSLDSGSPSSASLIKCCDCGCECSMINWSLLGTDMRSVKCKYQEFEGERQSIIPGYPISQNARVEIENECTALRETVGSQQETIQDLICELDEERNASSSAANEAMSMILRLQSEKAEVDMESRQFKRFTEEKIAHDLQEISALEYMLYKKDHAIESLTCEVQAYKHRMMSFGLTEAEVDELVASNEERMSRNTSMSENLEGQSDGPGFNIYPPLKCKTNRPSPNGCDETVDIEKYAFNETPYSGDQLKDLDCRINELEKTPKTIQLDREYIGTNNVFERVIVGRSPKFGSSIKKIDYSHLDVSSNLRKVENAPEFGDDMNDRVYTIDSIHQGASANGVTDHDNAGDNYATTAMNSLNRSNVKDLEIQKLHVRLQALEADRETMRQSIISVGTDKAQLVLLKEIALNLCKEMTPSGGMPLQKKSATKLSSMSLFKSVASLVSWRRRAQKSRYTFGLPTVDPGLVTLLEKGPCLGLRRYISSTNLWN